MKTIEIRAKSIKIFLIILSLILFFLLLYNYIEFHVPYKSKTIFGITTISLSIILPCLISIFNNREVILNGNLRKNGFKIALYAFSINIFIIIIIFFLESFFGSNGEYSNLGFFLFIIYGLPIYIIITGFLTTIISDIIYLLFNYNLLKILEENIQNQNQTISTNNNQ